MVSVSVGTSAPIALTLADFLGRRTQIGVQNTWNLIDWAYARGFVRAKCMQVLPPSMN